MLPRRHILDVIEFVKDKEDLVPMCTVTLALDAIKHLDPKYKKDHLVEALELNEFICYMYPVMRPRTGPSSCTSSRTFSVFSFTGCRTRRSPRSGAWRSSITRKRTWRSTPLSKIGRASCRERV